MLYYHENNNNSCRALADEADRDVDYQLAGKGEAETYEQKTKGSFFAGLWGMSAAAFKAIIA